MNYMRNYSILLLATLLAFPCFTSGRTTQSTADKKKLKQADNLFTYADFEGALPIYLDVLPNSPDNWLINYRIGVCYYYSTTARPKSVSYLDKAVNNSRQDTVPDLLYHAGLAHLCVNDFDAAEKYLLAFKKKAGPKYKDPLLDQLIRGCSSGREQWKNQGKMRITNLGENVNSDYPDYAPVVIYRSDILLFTSKRPGTTGHTKDDEGFFYEDIYQAKGESWNRWKEPSRYDTSNVKRRGIFSLLFNKAEVVTEINTEDHDGSITLSPDSTDLYIFRYGDIMKASWDGKRWHRPNRIGEEIDARASHEPSIFLSRDSKTMFFVSDRKHGVGKKDIWICEKEGNNWGKPRNLGMEVNTPFNEDSPFLSPDGNTLYFSSEGHNSMGGYDVFKCTKQENGRWSAPVNLGAPINNGGDDIFYTPLENGSGAYYASLNREGEGDLDLYFIQYFPPVTPTAKLLVNGKGLGPQDKLNVRITSPDGKELQSFSMSSSDSILYEYEPGSTVNFEVSAPCFTTVNMQVNYPNETRDEFVFQQMSVSCSPNTANVTIHNYGFAIDNAVNPATVNDPFTELPGIRINYLNSVSEIGEVSAPYKVSLAEGSSMTIANNGQIVGIGRSFQDIHFGFDSYELSPNAKTEVAFVVAWMNNNPDSKIEVIGHADEKGSSMYNQSLSEKRANSVKQMLVSSGVNPNRIITVGKGENEPVLNDPDLSPDDPGKLNRRVIVRVAE
jgi:outer membrane protein OmpA-like peptidoglycan-associated protein/tetratricopeptide (TPR) repeat protein